MRVKAFIVLFSGFLLSGCVQHTGAGTVAMAIDDELVHVCVSEEAVDPGDRVAFFRNQCDPVTGPGGKDAISSVQCERVQIGEGLVLENLNEHYSTVRITEGSQVSEGVMVEKIR